MLKIVLTTLLGIFAVSYSASAQTAPATATVVSDTTALKEFTGKYKFEGLPFEYMEFSLKAGSLTVQAGDQGGAMAPIKDAVDKFETADGAAKFTFARNEEKKVAKVTVEYQGMVFEGKKE
ncbi:hypothetical protein [Runella slithyformis]|uniref:DUF3471 domain-containing protein n=1 Tax=Runella slithyformis (strain ATCC 29530 / DSM 19594 / LMG 11500 / NCIMB 11436 / LSU 4) TaxID=761193 RepID=A0A7U4E6A1_RUNSL|nr:hypothetical protein [Runella slithyformis]AEI49323.1 hypothetical protein Runsl_2935 [Runella slithyformis DSM 19594]